MNIAENCRFGIQKRMDMDWNLARAVLAVAETGSLSAAAQRLGQTQPTLGRQIKAAEAQLGTELFTRAPRGLTPTDTCRALLPALRDMSAAAARLSLLADGQDSDLSGVVRLTASEVVSHYWLPPILADLRRDAPEIEIELVPSDQNENLL